MSSEEQQYITIEEFMREFNYNLNGAEEQDDETLQELQIIIQDMMQANCGTTVPFRFKNYRGQIELL